MRAISKTAAGAANQNGGQSATGTDKFVRITRINGQRISFGDLARFACPAKTDAWLAHVSGCDARTCRRWLAGDSEPPAEAFGAIMFEIMRLYQRRD